MKIITCIAPVNIAVIKYWGKRDEDLILPVNDSLSATLSTENMCAKTTILASPNFEENKFWLNGKEEQFTSQRLNNCLKEVKHRLDPNSPMHEWKLHICSVNNFPTAAGLASSAAGYACLVSTLASLYNIEGDVSRIARIGSGSACRSVLGGWVQWHKGALSTGLDSIATQICPAAHWPQMRIVVLVVNDSAKKCSSTSGMQQSMKTSRLLQYRAEEIVPERIARISEAIKKRDFDTFARITMQDSNQFHAICLDTFPPCVYMNDVSHSIVELVHSYNTHKGCNGVAYTFDAGPNACLFLLEDRVQEVVSLVNETFPSCSDANQDEYFRGISVELKNMQSLREELNLKREKKGCLKYVICTRVGEGPQILTDESQHLLDRNGLPKRIS